MTTLLSLILIALIVLIILAGIGVFNIKNICNFCDFVQGIQYHSHGTLNSIYTTLNQLITNQGTLLNSIEKFTDDDLPFPEDECKDEPTPEKDEREHFILTEDTTSDAIIEAYKNEIIAIHCANEDEWKESVEAVSFFGVTTNERKAPNKDDSIKFDFDIGDGKKTNCHAIQSILIDKDPNFFIYMIMSGVKTINNFVQGNADDMGKCYDIIEWSDIRKLVIDSIAKQADDAPTVADELAEKAENVAETIEPVIDGAGAMLRAIRDEKSNECVCVDCSETPENASEDIPASPVEFDDTTEDKGEADA